MKDVRLKWNVDQMQANYKMWSVEMVSNYSSPNQWQLCSEALCVLFNKEEYNDNCVNFIFSEFVYCVLYDFVSLCVFLGSRLIVPMGAVGACNPILSLLGSRVQTDLWLRCTIFLEHCVFVFVELCLCVLHFLITVQSSWVSRACVCGLWRVRWRWDSHEMDLGGCAVRTGGRSGLYGGVGHKLGVAA